MRRGTPVLLLLSILAIACVEPVRRERAWEVHGEPASATVVSLSGPSADGALDEIVEASGRIAALLDPDDPFKPLRQLNAKAATAYTNVNDRDLYRALLLALDYARASRGAYDPTIGPLSRLYRAAAQGGPDPSEEEIARGLRAVGWQRVDVAEDAYAVRLRGAGMELDLGGLERGFALDAAARAFARTGSVAALLRIGGVTYAWGVPPGGAGWDVAVADPRDGSRPLLRVRLANRACAALGTGAGRARAHVPVLDPSTGRPPDGDVRVAVAFADSGADAELIARTLLVAGSIRGGEYLGRARRTEAVLLVRDDRGTRLLVSASLAGRVEPSAELTAEANGDVRYTLPPESF